MAPRPSDMAFRLFVGSKSSVVLFYLGLLILGAPTFFRLTDRLLGTSVFSIYDDGSRIFQTIGAVLIAAAIITFFARYLGIFDDLARSDRSVDPDFRAELLDRLKALEHAARDARAPEVRIPEDVSEKIVNTIETKAKSALSSSVIKESFSSYAKHIYDERSLEGMDRNYSAIITDLKKQLESWRRNANTNLLLGLGCALSGMLFMYFTLVNSIQISAIEGSLRQGDLTVSYYFISRIGLVIIVESVAFFFLKLYREDRSMIRYLRNEVTNVELKYLSLRSAVSFASAGTLEKILTTLVATERNFVLRKDERVISDLTHENSEIMLEKVVARLIPSFPGAPQPKREGDGAVRRV